MTFEIWNMNVLWNLPSSPVLSLSKFSSNVKTNSAAEVRISTTLALKSSFLQFCHAFGLKINLILLLRHFWTLNYPTFKQQKGNKIYKLQSSQVNCTPKDPIDEFIIRKLNLLVVVDFRFISAFVMSGEFTHNSVTKFLPAQFPWIWCKCLLTNLIHSKIFNLTKYRKVLVKYSLLIAHAGMPIWIWQ